MTMPTNAQLKPVPPDVADRMLNQGRESEEAWERMRAEWCAVHETPEAVAAMSQID
jgi:hypothetical protein